MASSLKTFAALPPAAPEADAPRVETLPPREGIEAQFAYGRMRIRPLSAGEARARIESPLALHGLAGGEAFALELGAEPCSLLASRLEPLILWNDLAPEARAHALEHLFADALAKLENLLGAGVEFQTLRSAKEAHDSAGFPFEFTVGDLQIPMLVRTRSTALSAALHTWVTAFPRRRPLVRDFHVAIRWGKAELSWDELRGLRVGDGLFAETTPGAGAFAVLNESFIAAAELKPPGFELSQPLLTPPNSQTRPWLMNEDLRQSFQERPIPGRLGDIAVRVVFDLGRIDVRLEHLEAMTAGHVFALERPDPDLVEIVAGGRVIGSGALVRKDGLYAVQVKSLNP